VISLTARVGLIAAVVVALFTALTAVALDQAFRRSAERAAQERLAAQLYLVMADAELVPGGGLTMPIDLGEARLQLPGSGLYALILDGNGKALWRSPSALGIELPPVMAGERFGRSRQGVVDYFFAGLAVRWETSDGGEVPLRFLVYENLTAFNAELAGYRRSLWGRLALMAVLLLAGLAAALAWGLRPLRTMGEELKAIEQGQQEQLAQPYPRELHRITHNLNALLAHERAQQARYRNALADLAHSLKTPLAVLRALPQPDPRSARTLEEQVGRMDAIVQHQLGRAATSGRSILAAPIALEPPLQRLLATLAKVHAAKAVVVTSHIATGCAFRGSEGDLMELLGNLLDNAYKWCRHQVQISAETSGERLQLTVEDDGPGIPAERAAQVLERGVRLDELTPGHGIGLAMVAEMVAAYSGELRLEQGALGGLRAVLWLPGRRLG